MAGKDTKTEVDAVNEEHEKAIQTSVAQPEDDYKIDKLFYRICHLCYIMGVNFHGNRSAKMRCLSMILVGINCSINLYFVGCIVYLTLSKPFQTDRVATSITIGTWVLQAALSTIFVAYWQYTNQPNKILKLIYEANKGAGIHYYRKKILMIVNWFYIVLALIVCYYLMLVAANLMEINVGYWDVEISKIVGNRRLFAVVQLSSLYCKLCWGVALFIYGLLIHSTNYEFTYYNQQVQSINCKYETSTSLYDTDEVLCDYLLKLMKVHSRLAECVQRLDKMFHIYAFAMLVTIIPTTIFSLFMVVRRPSESFCWEMLLSCPLVFFCILSFCALVNAPSRLHRTIYDTKSALCANTNIWFPYRPNVYHSALAFVCHLDQTNLGVSIWGFAVVSKPLVLTTLSVMVTCLALFLQVGECNSSY